MDPYVITTKPKIAHLCFLPIEWILISSQENAAPLGIIGSLGAKYHRRANLYSNRNHPEQINKHAWDISRNRREKSTRKRGPTMKNLVEGDVVGLKEDARNPLFFFRQHNSSKPTRARKEPPSQVQLVFCPLVCAGDILGKTVRWGKFEEIFTVWFQHNFDSWTSFRSTGTYFRPISFFLKICQILTVQRYCPSDALGVFDGESYLGSRLRFFLLHLRGIINDNRPSWVDPSGTDVIMKFYTAVCLSLVSQRSDCLRAPICGPWKWITKCS